MHRHIEGYSSVCVCVCVCVSGHCDSMDTDSKLVDASDSLWLCSEAVSGGLIAHSHAVDD